ncbi:SDR family NAD(P)-dependent oxidoreductase [Aquiflexum sp. TKW24L]|uniref:SDR family NAD(P)-dependent oxidoreductase n=1 Tax=Aquiflexum sp. TKW24L TaxID=2942212 RepID=UPI0020BF3DFC|nr:SDR family NAD(P)-dependent oxidoreductase [Aquiflexum sp. TKW24L]MCL6258137.1 SDR family NAD(P)-dependent oxidoreductase [Aquiflexum sp. TKW24L]
MKHFVLITGASEGLGKSFAIESAKRGMDLFLVSLPETGLPELCGLIKSNFEVFVDFLELDLTDVQNCIHLIDYVKAKNYPISFLINNAGVGGNYRFANESFIVFNRMIQLNITALTLITHKLMDTLQDQESAFILNVSSMAAHFEGPYKQVYGATKSYIYYFSKSLGQELENTNVHVSVMSPGGISSNISHIRKSQLLNIFSKSTFLDPEFVAEYGIQKCLEKRVEIIPGRLTKGYFMFSKLLPKFIKKKLIQNTTTEIFNAQTILHNKGKNGEAIRERLKERIVKNAF